MSVAARAWFLVEPKAPLVERELVIAAPGAAEAVIAIHGNGVCHTDLGFADGGVRTNHPLPLVLGHEAVGTVVAAGASFGSLIGKTVVVPAVLPCGECGLCRAGRGNACPQQKMPGNDIHGGFATHMLVPAQPLQVLAHTGGVDERLYSVVADALSTAWQATRRAQVQSGDLCVVVGAGGVGGFTIQVCAALGARVIALDVSPERLELMTAHGAHATVDTRGKSARDVRDEVQRHAKGFGLDPWRTRIFECAGTPSAQEVAFTLIGRGSTMVQVGFTPEKVSLRLSNLMAFDATVHGTWGCPPEQYPSVLELIAAHKIALEPFVEVRPMRDVNAVLDDMRAHKLRRRVALDPRL
jgi:6-hydroxycyclohex-1-ene-1-carbonyl-CoA dehydrogenase